MNENKKTKKFSKDGMVIIAVVGLFAISQTYYFFNLNKKVDEYTISQVQASNQTYNLYESVDKAISKKDSREIIKKYTELTQGNHFSLSLAGIALKNVLTEKYREQVTGVSSEKLLPDDTIETMKKVYVQAMSNPFSGAQKELTEIRSRFQCSWIDLPCKLKSNSLTEKLNNSVLMIDRKNKADYYDITHIDEYIDWQKMKFLKAKKQEPLITQQEIYSPGQRSVGISNDNASN